MSSPDPDLTFDPDREPWASRRPRIFLACPARPTEEFTATSRQQQQSLETRGMILYDVHRFMKIVMQ